MSWRTTPHSVGFGQQKLARLDSDCLQRQIQSDASHKSLRAPLPRNFMHSGCLTPSWALLLTVEARGCLLTHVAQGPGHVCCVHFWTARPCVHKASTLGPCAVKPSSSQAEAEWMSKLREPGYTAENAPENTGSWRFTSPGVGHRAFSFIFLFLPSHITNHIMYFMCPMYIFYIACLLIYKMFINI